jgi:hypothetical protein
MPFDLSRDQLPQGPETVLLFLQEERDCGAFTVWQQGFNPKEHRDILDRAEAREYDLRRDLAIQAREEARDKRAEDWHKEQMKALREQHRNELLAFGGLIALATVIGSIRSGLLSRG